MSKLRRKFITVLAVLFCTLLCISTALIIPKNEKVAEAYASPQSPTISEIYSDKYNRFNHQALQKLYDAILSGTDKTLDEVATAANTNTVLSNKEIQVQFGGMVWTAVYLSKATESFAGTGAPAKGKATNGDVVLTLWLAFPDISKPAKWNLWYGDSTRTYPCNMYGTSYMRSVVLNNGGEYVSNATTLTSYTATDDNEWNFSKFTNPTYKENGVGNPKPSTIMNHLVSPRYISWQYNQSSKTTVEHAYNCNNDAWGKVNNIAYESYDKYDAWKDDLLWLPSVTETGSLQGNKLGLWQISQAQRGTQSDSVYNWLRSTSGGNTAVWTWQGSDKQQDVFTDGTLPDKSLTTPVRPALHLNLTTADKDSRRIFFDDDTAGAEEHEYELVYNGGSQEIDILDYDMLAPVGTATAGSNYSSTTGKFSATTPNKTSDKTYEMTVKPKNDFYWDDITDSTKTTKERKYKIKMKLADVSIEWDNTIARTYGASLLLDSDEIQGIKVKGGQQITTTYHKEFDTDDYPADTPEPTDWSDVEANFKAESSGYYRVWYKIEVDYHNTKIASYGVEVSSDSVVVNVTGVLGDGSAEYAKDDANELTNTTKLNQWFTELVDSGKITMTGKNGAFTPAQIKGLLADMNVVLCTKNSSGKLEEAIQNSHNRYDVGEYYIDLKYTSNTGEIKFNWTFEQPMFKVEKRTIHAVVAEENDGELTHEYGESRVGLKCKIVSGVASGEDENDVGFGTTFTVRTTGQGLNSSTKVGEYDMVGTASADSNYTVIFDEAIYTVTKRAMKLQVADETVEYGKNFEGYKFKSMTIKEGSLVGDDSLAELTAGATYSLKRSGVDYDFSNSLLINDYDLYAGVETDGKYIFETDNYIFEILPGKLTVTKANFNLSGVRLDNKGYVYDGEPHPAKLTGELPDGVTVSYRYVNYETAEELEGAPTEVGLYLVYASFSHDSPNHNLITTVKAAYIRIAYTEEEANADFPALPTDEELAAAADLAKKKADAKEELEKEAKDKKDAVDADVNLSAEEKKAAKDEIDKELEEGRKEIDNAKDKDSVDSALSDGKKEIDDTADLAQKKGAAKSELDKAAQAKKDAIDNDPNLTDEEKAAAKAEVDKELEEGKKAIDDATDLSAVQSAESSTKTNIENIKAEHKGSFPWWILAIIAGALVLVVVIVIVIVKRRGSDDDDGGYDDFYDDEYDYDEEEVDDDGDEAFGY